MIAEPRSENWMSFFSMVWVYGMDLKWKIFKACNTLFSKIRVYNFLLKAICKYVKKYMLKHLLHWVLTGKTFIFLKCFWGRQPLMVTLCVCVCVCVPTCVCVRFVMSNSVTPWAVAHQAPLFMEFSRQGYWSGFLFLRVIIIE